MFEILISVAAKVAEYLVDPIKLQFSYLFNSHRNVQDLVQKIDTLGDRRRRVEELAEQAIRQGDEIFSDVQEWLQATQAILQTREGFVKDEEQASKSCFHLKPRYDLSKRAKRQGEDIDAKLQQAHGFGRDTVSYRPPPPTVTSCASSTNDAEFPSRQSLFDQIMEALRNEQTSIVGVWGMGGVGKTTLALQVAKRAEEEKLFHKVVMKSSISQSPIISDIQTELARTLGVTFLEGQDRSVTLMNNLKNQKNILVILDDIWDKLDLRKIGIPYGDDNNGCKILLTSREYEVVVTDMMAQQVFHLPHLGAEEAWSLFKRTTGDSVESPELKDTADGIVKKCEGLPIAIITIANALKNKSVGEWKNALKELKRAKPTNIRGMSKNVYSCLELSYNHLEGDEVKSLFLLCALLGGRSISKDHLLLYATGLNMFEGMYSTEETTNKLITLVGKLIASSLLLKVEGRDNYPHRSLFFDDMFVKMHDVVRDVARSIASKDARCHYAVGEAVELREWERRGECRNYSGISLECEDPNELPPRLVCPELELFLLNSSLDPSLWSDKPKLIIPEGFFQGVTKLRVLHLSGVSLTSSSSPLGFLSNLHTLCLIGCQLEDMIIIGEMKRLQVLSLAKSNIVELPKEIGQLKDLRVLDLGYCSQLRIIPRNVISSLSGLECLNLGECREIEWGRDAESNNNRACVSEIKDLPRLTTLEVQVSDSSLIPEDIGLDLVNLARHAIWIGYMNWEYLGSHLLNKFSRNLIVGGVKSPVLKSFSNLFRTCQLVILGDLDGISNVVYDLANENGFPQLECLIIEGCSTIRHIVSSSGWPSPKWIPPRDTFCRLDRLELYLLHDLESVFDFHESAPLLIESFGKLRSLCLGDCEKLRCVMSLPMQHGRELTFFPRLQELTLRDLPNLINLCSTATPEDSQVPMPTLFCQQAAFPALEELNVIRLGHHLRALWHNQFPTSSFSKLKKLKVEYSHGLQKAFYASLMKALVQLKELEIIQCQLLEEIVANEDEDIEDDQVACFPKLAYLKLEDLPLLKRFCLQAMNLRWLLLKQLSLRRCGDQVTTVFKGIGSEGEVDAPPLFLVEKEAFSYLKTLSLRSLNGVVEIWRGQFSRVSFSNLKKLSIWRCPSILFVIHSNMFHTLVNLEELWVGDCDSVKEFIQPLDDDEPTIDEIDFSRLRIMRLIGLPNFKCFCSATYTFRFPSLESLLLLDCPKMSFFCLGGLHIHNISLKEKLLPVLHSNTQAIHETSTGQSGASNIASTSQNIRSSTYLVEELLDGWFVLCTPDASYLDRRRLAISTDASFLDGRRLAISTYASYLDWRRRFQLTQVILIGED